ncbi:MAG: zinc ribbon domain-containing protein [Anaerolineaceae bacterium]
MGTIKIYHGDLTPSDLANDLVAQFNRGVYQVQKFGQPDRIAVQIATRRNRNSGGDTALTVTLDKVEDGVSVQTSKQLWFGLAASLGMSALSTLRNPLAILGRLDDIAQDVESLQLEDSVMEVIDYSARQHGSGHAISERLQKMICPFCTTPNPMGSSRCLACGAPLADVQPQTCLVCGFVTKSTESICPNCGSSLKVKLTPGA